MFIVLNSKWGDASDTSIFKNQNQYQMKKSTAQIIAIIILCLVICTADSWFNF